MRSVHSYVCGTTMMLHLMYDCTDVVPIPEVLEEQYETPSTSRCNEAERENFYSISSVHKLVNNSEMCVYVSSDVICLFITDTAFILTPWSMNPNVFGFYSSLYNNH